MQSTHSPRYKIDERVFSLMILLGLLSFIILSFRFRNTDPCESFSISATSSEFVTANLISFSAETVNGKTFRWNFGDGSYSDYSARVIQHQYRLPGSYLVSVIVNDHCEATYTVLIQQARVIVNESLPGFVAPQMAETNIPVEFKDTTTDATSWEWMVDDISAPVANTKKISYTFVTPGEHIVLLRVNGRDDRVTSKKILIKAPVSIQQIIKDAQPPRTEPDWVGPVIPPVPPFIPPRKDSAQKQEPAPLVAPLIEADAMTVLLEEAMYGKKTNADFLLYFCGEPDIEVEYNGRRIKFSQMINYLKKLDKKKNQQLEVKLVRKNKTNCIVSMTVISTRKKFIDRVFDKD